MKSNIKNFVEEYNKRMSWNADIIKQIGKENISVKVIDDYLSTELITEENYDLENASLYEYGPADERLYYYESLEYLKMVFIDILSYRKCTVSVDFC